MALSNNNWNLTFTLVFGEKQIVCLFVFLDTRLFINTDGTIGSTLHCKQTAGNTCYMLLAHIPSI